MDKPGGGRQGHSLSRRKFLTVAGSAGVAVAATQFPFAKARYRAGALHGLPVHARRRVGRPDVGQRRALDAARAVAAGRQRRDARQGDPGPVGGRQGRELHAGRRQRRGARHLRRRALGARRAAGSAGGLRVLLPLQGQRRDQPGRPHEDRAERRARARWRSRSRAASSTSTATTRPTSTCRRRTWTWSSTSATTSTSTTRTRTRRPAATSARTPTTRSSTCRTTASATRSTRPTRTCRPRTPNFAWLVTFDDHEVDNNWAADIPEEGMPLDIFARRRRAAFKAYWEHMPLRKADAPHGQRDPDLPARASTATWRRST